MALCSAANRWPRTTASRNGRRSCQTCSFPDGADRSKGSSCAPRAPSTRATSPPSKASRASPSTRLLIDLSDSLIAEELTALIHQAAYLHLLDLKALREAIQRANGHHHLDVLEQAIEDWLDGSAGTRSRGEVAFRRALTALGLPRPLTNRKVEGIEVDFHWPDRKLIIEIDGPNHQRPPTRSTDRSRDDELIAAGWTLVRSRTYERALERLRTQTDLNLP